LAEEKQFALLQSGDGGFASDGGKVIQKLSQRLPAFEVVKQRLKGDARAAKDGCSTENFWISRYDLIYTNHGLIFLD
jgi:hypothetical protein